MLQKYRKYLMLFFHNEPNPIRLSQIFRFFCQISTLADRLEVKQSYVDTVKAWHSQVKGCSSWHGAANVLAEREIRWWLRSCKSGPWQEQSELSLVMTDSAPEQTPLLTRSKCVSVKTQWFYYHQIIIQQIWMNGRILYLTRNFVSLCWLWGLCKVKPYCELISW